MFLLNMCGIVFAAYLAAGRTGSIAACLFLDIGPWQTLGIALAMDYVQIPVYGILIEASQQRMARPGRFQQWVKRKSEKLQKRMRDSRLWQPLARFRHLPVVVLAILPFRGGGVFSACVLAFMMGCSRVAGTCLIMTGSVAGACITLAVLYFPARWLHAL
jgi:uncharacterized membrane protein